LQNKATARGGYSYMNFIMNQIFQLQGNKTGIALHDRLDCKKKFFF